MNLVFLVSVVISLPLLILYKEHYSRLDMDNANTVTKQSNIFDKPNLSDPKLNQML